VKLVVSELWVLNASPLILLSKARYEWLLFELAEQLLVPQVVAAEIERGPDDDAAKVLLASDRLPVIETGDAADEIVAWDLGRGETAVLGYVLANPTWTAVLDDGLARRCANSFELRLKGTLSIILLARQQALIPSAASALIDLRAAGARLSDALIREALRRTVGEDWS